MQEIRKKIVAWYKINKRDLPWRHSSAPYVIWLSEIIMQQTRIDQGTPYFLRFLKAFPTVQSFANASEQDILKLWQGLGYYSRARNMHHTAKVIIEKYNGVFPDNYKGMVELKGIGDYTASLILSVCNNLTLAVVDGNVYRVLSRIFGARKTMENAEGKKYYKKLAEELLDKKNPGDYNQAMMELGALVCKPSNPLCVECPVQKKCFAYRQNMQNILPLKTEKKKLKERFFHYFYVTDNASFLLNKRIHNDIWKNLYDFPMIETKNKTKISKQKVLDFFNIKNCNLEFVIASKHLLSHQNLNLFFYNIHLDKINKKTQKDYISVSLKKSNNYPLPKPIEIFFNKIILKEK